MGRNVINRGGSEDSDGGIVCVVLPANGSIGEGRVFENVPNRFLGIQQAPGASRTTVGTSA